MLARQNGVATGPAKHRVSRCRRIGLRARLTADPRGNMLSHQVRESCNAIVRACAKAWTFSAAEP